MPDSRTQLTEYLWRHRDELIVYLARRLGSASVAETVAREVMFELRSAQLQPRITDVRGYLFAFATQLGIDRLLREGAASAMRRQLDVSPR